MIDHGALVATMGVRRVSVPDRHHQRKQVQLNQSLETAHKRVDKKAEALKAQQDKVAESESKGHGKRLAQRTRTLLTLAQAFKEAKAQQAQCSEHASTLGPAGQRADVTSASRPSCHSAKFLEQPRFNRRRFDTGIKPVLLTSRGPVRRRLHARPPYAQKAGARPAVNLPWYAVSPTAPIKP